MKSLLIAGSLSVFALCAVAGVLGILENSQPVTTVSGQAAWRCTYNVGGQKVTVVVKNVCPPTMQFE